MIIPGQVHSRPFEYCMVQLYRQRARLIHQKMFESRLFFVDKLIDMGARIVSLRSAQGLGIGLDREQPLRGLQ